MKTKPLTKEEYRSTYTYDPADYIKKLVNKDEQLIETVVDLQGRAGSPIYQECEVSF